MTVNYFTYNYLNREQKGKHTVSPALLWEYDLSNFDWQATRRTVVSRIIERGRPEDYYAAFDIYGIEGFRDTLKEIPYMSSKDANFASIFFDIPKEQMRCYIRKR